MDFGHPLCLLCHRVLVFRDGSIFETFEKEEIDPNVILEGMFGHSKKSTSSQQKIESNNSPVSNDGNKTATASFTKTPSKPTNIKVVDFKTKSNQSEKIKIKYF